MAVLLALFGPKRGVRLEIDTQATLGPVVGRGSAAGRRQGLAPALPVHGARRRLEVEDLGSHNGTFVNGEKLTAPRALARGRRGRRRRFAVPRRRRRGRGGGALRRRDLIVTPGSAPAEVARPRPRPTDAGGRAPRRRGGAGGRARGLPRSRGGGARRAGGHGEGARAEARLRPAVGSSAGDRAAAASGARTTPRSLSRARCWSLAAQRKRAVAVEDAVEDRVLRQARSVVRNQLRAVAVAPVLLGGEVAGFLHVDRAQQSTRRTTPRCSTASRRRSRWAGTCGRPGPRRSSRRAPVGRGRSRRAGLDAPIGVSAAWRAALRSRTPARAAASTVLITGESGTGKEEIAGTCTGGARARRGPFVAVNCGAIAETLARERAVRPREGRVHRRDGVAHGQHRGGRRRHAVPRRDRRAARRDAGEAAARAAGAACSCRVGATARGAVDVRIVAATHRDLDAEVARRAVPRGPLLSPERHPHRDPAAARAAGGHRAAGARTCSRARPRAGRRDPGITDGASRALRATRWPGNVRELGNVIERALVLRAPEATGPSARGRGRGVAGRRLARADRRRRGDAGQQGRRARARRDRDGAAKGARGEGARRAGARPVAPDARQEAGRPRHRRLARRAPRAKTKKTASGRGQRSFHIGPRPPAVPRNGTDASPGRCASCPPGRRRRLLQRPNELHDVVLVGLS